MCNHLWNIVKSSIHLIINSFPTSLKTSNIIQILYEIFFAVVSNLTNSTTKEEVKSEGEENK